MNPNAINWNDFCSMMETLKNCYHQKIDEGDWQGKITVYHQHLIKYDVGVLVNAFDRCWRVHREFFPSLAELDELCQVEIGNQAWVSARDAAKKMPSPKPREIDGVSEGHPCYGLLKKWREQGLSENPAAEIVAAIEGYDKNLATAIGSHFKRERDYIPREGDFCVCGALIKGHDYMAPNCTRKYHPKLLSGEHMIGRDGAFPTR